MQRDYYAVLGIASTAGPREIRQAYRRLARQYSPDVNFWDENARPVFDEIAEAYRILSDPGARALYDRVGVRRGPHRHRRGDDVHVVLASSFAEAAGGGPYVVSVTRFSPCPLCEGAGDTEDGRCDACDGRGVRRATERVLVPIPPGVDTGTQIRVAGEGHAGPLGGGRGDLVVNVRVREHPFFTRKGDNVHCDLPISVWEAIRGARVKIPTPAGETVLVIPPGTPGGEVYRLRGEGLPRLAADGRGDLLITVRVDVPRGLDARTDELVREMERLMPMDPRADLDRFRGGAE